MITVKNVSKSFEGFMALSDLEMNVKKGSIYGLVGTNGAGKTTVIKHIAGVYKENQGLIQIEGEPVYDNSFIKERIGYVPDDLYFFGSYSLKEMGRFYKGIYPNWSQERFDAMVARFGLNPNQKLTRFSKGMQKQATFILTMSTRPDYLILDEPIDGLDPIIRKLVWKYIVDDVAEREMTVLVSSHNLREMENICDAIGIISGGKMVIERDLDELRSDIHKVQLAFSDKEKAEGELESLNILHREHRGSVELLIIRNRKDEVEALMEKVKPVIFDMLPLTLEEIFIYELGGADDEIQGIIF
ncbi:MAG: ABC transporter ATP-binding protein [Anaerovoracaceae bacterium]|jgi:ABC-2 type transport system ATP-binding protein|nr:ABC transporter ATP-binding protein [Anaerovoracaceae bacterium]